jgi:hypothetical protein
MEFWDSRFLWNIGTYLTDYMVSQPRGLENLILTAKNFKSHTEVYYDE